MNNNSTNAFAVEAAFEDERKGLPSASSMHRIMTCSAFLPLYKHLREAGQLPPAQSSDDADRGTELHGHLEDLAYGRTPFGEYDDIALCREMFAEARRQIVRSLGEDIDSEGITLLIEERLWHRNLDGEDIASGKFDLVAIDSERKKAVIIDYKTGHLQVPLPFENWQILHGAGLLNRHFDVESVTGVIVYAHRKPTVGEISPQDIEDTMASIEWKLGRTGHYLDYGFFATEENCKYCPVRLSCPRLHVDLTAAEKVSTRPDPAMAIASMDTPRLGEFLVRLETVALLEKAAKAEMTARLKNGLEDDNWELRSGSSSRKVLDTRLLVNALVENGVDLRDAIEAMSINVGDAEKLFKAANPSLKGAQFKERFAELSDPFLTISTPAPTLKRKKAVTNKALSIG